jgi:hypothetical protein
LSSVVDIPPTQNVFFTIFMLLLIVIVLFLLLGATEVAFQQLGFARLHIILILIGAFLGSSVNLPMRRVKRFERHYEMEEVRFLDNLPDPWCLSQGSLDINRHQPGWSDYSHGGLDLSLDWSSSGFSLHITWSLLDGNYCTSCSSESARLWNSYACLYPPASCGAYCPYS